MMRSILSRRVLALFGAALSTPLFLSGCGGQPGANGQSSVSSVLAGAGRSIGAARAYDHLTRAMESSDADVFLQATAQMQENGAWPLVEHMVQQRVQTARTLMDAHQLNSLGYMLADKGQYPQQFVAAEALTRQALKIYDQNLDSFRAGATPSRALIRAVNQAKSSRAAIRDSLAWALFRQGRYEEALAEQEKAVAEARVSARVLGQEMPDELEQHLDQIRAMVEKQAPLANRK